MHSMSRIRIPDLARRFGCPRYSLKQRGMCREIWAVLRATRLRESCRCAEEHKGVDVGWRLCIPRGISAPWQCCQLPSVVLAGAKSRAAGDSSPYRRWEIQRDSDSTPPL